GSGRVSLQPVAGGGGRPPDRRPVPGRRSWRQRAAPCPSPASTTLGGHCDRSTVTVASPATLESAAGTGVESSRAVVPGCPAVTAVHTCSGASRELSCGCNAGFEGPVYGAAIEQPVRPETGTP